MARKRVVVKLIGDAKQEYLSLQEKVRAEKGQGVQGSFHQTLLNSIDSKISILKENYDYGVQIPRKLIPRKYVMDYGVTNLWKVNLAGYWRLVYTLKQPQREQMAMEVIDVWLDVLDIFDHKRYDKVFGYKKR